MHGMLESFFQSRRMFSKICSDHCVIGPEPSKCSSSEAEKGSKNVAESSSNSVLQVQGLYV